MKFYILGTTIVLLISGCSQQNRVIAAPVEIKKEKKHQYRDAAPKKNIKLKDVEDENFSSEYMYPETEVNKKSIAKIENIHNENIVTESSDNINTKECIALIGQDKFNKYSQIYTLSGALKKCKMLKSI